MSSRVVSGGCGSVGRSLDCSWAVKNELLQCRSGRRRGFNPCIGQIPWRGVWQPTPVFLPGKFHGQRSLTDYSPWDCKESDMTKATEHTQGGLLTGNQWTWVFSRAFMLIIVWRNLLWAPCYVNAWLLLFTSCHVPSVSSWHFPWQASHVGEPYLIVHHGKRDCLFHS